MRVRFTPAAIDELDNILAFVANQSSAAARRIQTRLKAITEILAHYPESGQRTSILSLRRMVTTPFPYLIFYQNVGDEVVIVGVRHSAHD